MVDKPVGLHSGVEHQVRAEDVDVLAREKYDRVNSDLSAEEEMFFIAASLITHCIARGYVNQTVDGCCKNRSDDQQEDKLHGSAGRRTSEGSIYTDFYSEQV